MLNKSKGNMYEFATHTWNPIRGECMHDCKYCYMKEFKVGKIRLDSKALNDKLGISKLIFVGSATDMWAENIPKEWISKVLRVCNYYHNNTYLFQSKNPERFLEKWEFPRHSILGTTIETNRDCEIADVSVAPWPSNRHAAMVKIEKRKMVSIEPVIDFDIDAFVGMIKNIQPSFVSIGADSKNHKLNEPSPEKIHALIDALRDFTKVIVKENMSRLIGERML